MNVLFAAEVVTFRDAVFSTLVIVGGIALLVAGLAWSERRRNR